MDSSKVHFLTGYVSAGGAQRTYCGKIGIDHDYEEENRIAIFSAIEDRTFAATADRRLVTCKNYLKAIGR